MKITLLGTGTSQGVPVIACPCPVCTSENPKDKRLRCSIMIEIDGKVFVIDSGPDFRQQMLRAKVKNLTAILYTHKHKDHVAGMDDVRAFNFILQKRIPLYVDALTRDGLIREFPYAFDGTDYPGLPLVDLIDFDDEPFEVEGVRFTPIPVLHHKMPVYGFRIGNFAYVTDASYISPASMDLLAGLDVLVLNALRKEKHVSHFNLEEALAVVAELKPQKTYFTHISHLMGKHDDVSLELPENVELAYDELSFVFDVNKE